MISKTCARSSVRFTAAFVLLLASGLALAWQGENREQSRWYHGAPPHPTLPVPAAPIFGAVALALTAGVARARRRSKNGGISADAKKDGQQEP